MEEGLSPLMVRTVSDTSNLLIRQLQHLYHRGDALVHLVRENQSGGLCFWVGLVEVSGCVPETLHFDFDERLALFKRQSEGSLEDDLEEIQAPPLLGFLVHFHSPVETLASSSP